MASEFIIAEPPRSSALHYIDDHSYRARSHHAPQWGRHAATRDVIRAAAHDQYLINMIQHHVLRGIQKNMCWSRQDVIMRLLYAKDQLDSVVYAARQANDGSDVLLMATPHHSHPSASPARLQPLAGSPGTIAALQHLRYS
jgi:hypothetical protein